MYFKTRSNEIFFGFYFNFDFRDTNNNDLFDPFILLISNKQPLHPISPSAFICYVVNGTMAMMIDPFQKKTSSTMNGQGFFQ